MPPIFVCLRDSCLYSNPECGRSKQARYQLSQPSQSYGHRNVERYYFYKMAIVLLKDNQKDEHERFLLLPCKGPAEDTSSVVLPVCEKPEVLWHEADLRSPLSTQSLSPRPSSKLSCGGVQPLVPHTPSPLSTGASKPTLIYATCKEPGFYILYFELIPTVQIVKASGFRDYEQSWRSSESGGFEITNAIRPWGT